MTANTYATEDFVEDAVTAIDGGDITTGTVADARIASTIARDSEVTSAISALSTVYQPLDSDLSSIAALTTTSFGRALLELADAAAGRTAFGLGTAATQATGAFDAAGAAAAAQAASQPLDSDLTAIAALTTTSYGRAFLALADAAAARTALSLGTAAQSASGDFQPIDSDLSTYAGITPGALGQAILPMTTLTNHGVVIGQAGGAPVATTAGTTDYPLVSNGASADPAFEQLSLTAGVQGVLPVANGGTGRSTEQDGWIADGNGWTYVSATSINIQADMTGVLQKGMKISYNDGAVDYGVIASVGAFSGGFTLITLVPNSDYSVASASLTATRYSRQDAPFDFPKTFGFAPTHGGYSADPTSADRFTIAGGFCTYWIRDTANGTSNAATTTRSVPIACGNVGSVYGAPAGLNNSGAAQTTTGIGLIGPALSLTEVRFGVDWSGNVGGFGTTLGKRVRNCLMIFPI